MYHEIYKIWDKTKGEDKHKTFHNQKLTKSRKKSFLNLTPSVSAK